MMLGGSCSPCCGSFQCDAGIVVRLDPAIVSDKWYSHHSPFFMLLHRVPELSNEISCFVFGEISAYRSAPGGYAYSECRGIQRQRVSIQGRFGVYSSYLSMSALYDVCGAFAGGTYIGGVSSLGGGDLSFFGNETSGEIPGQLKWWTLAAWLAAKDSPNNDDVPSDAILLTEDDLPNPWDFSTFEIPQSYALSVSGLPSGDGHFSKLAGVYQIPAASMFQTYERPFFVSDWPVVDYVADLPQQPTRYAIRGSARLTFDYRDGGLLPLRLNVKLYMAELYDQFTWLRTTLISTTVPTMPPLWQNSPEGAAFTYAESRGYPDGLTSTDTFSVPVYVATQQNYSLSTEEYREQFEPSVGNCSISVSSVMP